MIVKTTKRPKKGSSIADRMNYYTFYSPDGCWYWTGYSCSKGYGIIKVNKKAQKAHRVSFLIHNGPIGNMLVCHHCDNPPCINPNHLFLGSTKDNSMDMVKKGRSYNRYGSKNPNAKWDELTIKTIRDAHSAGFQRKNIAAYFKMKLTTLDHILYNSTWVHI